jgi:hypothetical protein
MISCSKKKNHHSFLRRDAETHIISAITSTQLALMRWNRNLCKLKHAHACIYYDQVACLPVSRANKSFRELDSHIIYFVYVQLQPSSVNRTRGLWQWIGKQAMMKGAHKYHCPGWGTSPWSQGNWDRLWTVTCTCKCTAAGHRPVTLRDCTGQWGMCGEAVSGTNHTKCSDVGWPAKD